MYIFTSSALINTVSSIPISHIFCDEAAQALEAEILIPISLAGAETAIILAGDHSQLPALVRSPLAKRFGLAISFQERLLYQCPAVYRFFPSDDAQRNIRKREKLPTKYITKLIRNYRCHPALLSPYNSLFYDGDLVAFVNRSKQTHRKHDST